MTLLEAVILLAAACLMVPLACGAAAYTITNAYWEAWLKHSQAVLEVTERLNKFSRGDDGKAA
jgi:hypothetical protein